RRRHTSWPRDWSSDVCSSDLPLDAARLDIMPALLWGRAESVRTLLRSLAQALAPLIFGAVSDHVFGGGRSGLQWTFVVMLVPLEIGRASCRERGEGAGGGGL